MNKARAVTEKKKIAVFLSHWTEAIAVGNGLPYKTLKAWVKDSIVHCQESIDRLVKSDAPVKVYVEHVDSSSKGSS